MEAKCHMLVTQVTLTSRGFQPRCFPLTLSPQTSAQDAIWTSCPSPFTLPGALLKLFSQQTVQLSWRRVNKSQRRANWGKGLLTRHQIEPVCSNWPVAVTWMKGHTSNCRAPSVARYLAEANKYYHHTQVLQKKEKRKKHDFLISMLL